jgi:flagellar basal-body rod protein FlgC
MTGGYGAFQTLAIANTSMGAHQTWLDALADNIANINTYEPTTGNAFQAQYPIFQAKAGGGVDVVGVADSDPQGRMEQMPDNPLADENGYVRAPDIDMASEMGQIIMAQRGFQAATSITKSAQTEYDAALQIGK